MSHSPAVLFLECCWELLRTPSQKKKREKNKNHPPSWNTQQETPTCWLRVTATGGPEPTHTERRGEAGGWNTSRPFHHALQQRMTEQRQNHCRQNLQRVVLSCFWLLKQRFFSLPFFSFSQRCCKKREKKLQRHSLLVKDSDVLKVQTRCRCLPSSSRLWLWGVKITRIYWDY